MSTLLARISQVLFDHELIEDDPTYWRCACLILGDSLQPGFVLHRHHVAAAIIDALKLTKEADVMRR